MSSHAIAVIGPHAVTSLFRASGAEVFDAANGAEALEHLKRLKEQTVSGGDGVTRYAVVFVIESLLNSIDSHEFERVSAGALPAVVAVPGIEGGTGESLRKLKRLTERAIGSDII